MKKSHTRKEKMLLSLSLAAVMVFTCTMPAMAAEPIGNGVHPTYDEAYYGTMDYYGNLTEGSVVKSYTLNGATELTDYGTYQEVVNLTDGTEPTVKDGSTTFQFNQESAPSHFYFEGKTTEPFSSLPWTLSVSYTLNGVPTRAEDLAGKTGVVEIKVDAIPNPDASEYARHNYTLEAMTMFNQDDILSLEAPGAQVQLIGNLRAVLFVALPGEEQHFTIRVGSDDFSFGGMTFLLVPATLSQLEEISKLGERKDELEEDYDKLSGSLDTLLDSFSSLGGSLRETANGLDQLNEARATLSAGKDQLYEQGDKVIEDLGGLSGSMGTVPDHLDQMDQAVTDFSESLSNITDTTEYIQSDLDEMDHWLSKLQKDMDHIRSNSDDLQTNLKNVGRDMDELQKLVEKQKKTMELLQIEIDGGILDAALPGASHIKIKGIPLNELLTAVDRLEKGWNRLDNDTDGKIDFDTFRLGMLMASGKTAEEAEKLIQLIGAVDAGLAAAPEGTTVEDLLTAQGLQEPEITIKAQIYRQGKPALELMKQVYAALCGSTDQTMDKVQYFAGAQMVQDIQKNPAQAQDVLAQTRAYLEKGTLLTELRGKHDAAKLIGLSDRLSSLLQNLGREDGLSGNLYDLVGDADDTLKHIDDTTGAARELLDHLNDVLDDVRDMQETLDEHVPGVHSTVQDAKNLTASLISTTDDTRAFLNTFRNLAKKSGSQLDAGTKKSLENLAKTLRHTANSTDAVGNVKSAKDSISEVIEDTWNEYTGDTNNLLLMDANAEAQSLTSDQNPAPTSIQILIRTQEIKEEEVEMEKLVPAQNENETIWNRVCQMFRDFWHFITNLFH